MKPFPMPPSDARPMALTHGGVNRPPFMGMGRRFLRGVTAIVIAAVVNTSLAPLVSAAQLKRSQAATFKASTTDEQSYADALRSIYDQASRPINPNARMPAPDLGNPDTLQSYADNIQAQWDALRAQWKTAGVSAAIVERQQLIEKEFRTRHEQFMTLFRAAKTGGGAERKALADFLGKEMPKPTHLPINLNNMPWQVLKPVKTEPAATEEALQKKLRLPAPKKASATQSNKTTANQRPFPKNATAPTADDLAPTLDAPHTSTIKKLAADLGKNPHRIYQWVHDNIYWQPTHGSVQGAQDTLDKKAGNATDTASLLIALLRAAGIPARYVYGSVEVPAEQMMNWVGGAKTIDAAQQVLGQGGIPNVALVSGGKISAVRIEHVWVEALIQYHPGRGARHVPGQSQPDTWVPMDGSYKQYSFKPGMDLAAAVPLDANALLNAAQQGAQTNQAEGWVQNLNTAALQSQLNAYQARLKTYIDSQNAGNSTVGDVLGQRNAQIDPLPYLAGTLPYTVKARTQQFSEVPDSLRAKFKYSIHMDQRSAAWGDSPILSFTAPTASLAGKKLTLAWVAASAADQRAIEALIPANVTDPSQLPRIIPASISLKPQILVDGQVKAEGYGLRAGSEPVAVGGFTRYGASQWDETQDQLIAGQQTALGLSIQGISQAQLDSLKKRMEDTKAILERAQAAPESQRAAILKGVTGDQLTGDLLTATIWGYFASLQSHGVLASGQAQMFDAPALSYGLFHAQVRPNKLYGIVTTGITFQGLNMDVGHLRHMRWVKDDNPSSAINNKPELTANGKSAAQNRWIAYNRMRGQYASAMEHAAPEAFWVDKTKCSHTDENGRIQNPTLNPCAEGISAVKAIAIAQSEGQKIYTINKANAQTALQKLPIGGEVGSKIRNAVNAGKEVTVHEKSINKHGWKGFGYIVIDPETGAGAYLIEGSGNGGIFLAIGYVYGFALGYTMLGLDAAIASKASSAFIGPMLTALALELASIAVIWQAYGALYGDKAQQCFATGIGLGLASANVAIAILGKLAGPPLPGGTITIASTSLIIAVISSNTPTETSSNCFK